MQRMTLASVAVLSMLSAFAVSPVQAQSSETHPIVGIWSLNLIRSSFEPGPGPQALTRRFSMDDDGFLVSVRATVAPGGNPSFSMARVQIDGGYYDVWGDTQLHNFLAAGSRGPGGSASFETIDDRTLRLTQKNPEGEVGPLGPNTWEVSSDGNTLTVRTSGTNGDGESVNNVEVFDRVQN
jgi:hypothetical protein